MKRILLIAFLSFTAFRGSSQTVVGLYGGAGCATSNNYNVAPSGGLELLFGMHHGGRMFIGADVFYQTYSLYYDNEANSEKHHQSYAGYIERLATASAFFAPKFSYGLGKTQDIKIYVDFGVGYNIGGFDSVRKWDNKYYNNSTGNYTYGNGVGSYDSTIDASKNINKLLIRGGCGATEYLSIGKHWFINFTEDFGFISQSLTQSTDPSFASRTQYSPGKFNPGYVSLQIGINYYSGHKK